MYVWGSKLINTVLQAEFKHTWGEPDLVTGGVILGDFWTIEGIGLGLPWAARPIRTRGQSKQTVFIPIISSTTNILSSNLISFSLSLASIYDLGYQKRYPWFPNT